MARAEPRVISIRGAREHNLADVSIDLPRDRLVVLTGLSGSGKSSLAFDTIYAEGQRRYVESLSAYARQFLEMMQKPDVDLIEGLSPAISIEQKTTSRNPRSTVGTVTEIYDYMRLLWARIGIPYSPATGLPIRSQTVSQMVDILLAMEEGTRLYLLAPVVRGRKGEYRKELAEYHRKGFSRVRIDGEIYDLDATPELDKKRKHDIELVVDRLIIRGDPDELSTRLADSLETALALTDGSPSPIMPSRARARFSRPISPVRSRGSRSTRSNRGCFPSTIRSAPARLATALGSAAISMNNWWYPTTARRCAVVPSRHGRTAVPATTSRHWNHWRGSSVFRSTCRLASLMTRSRG